MPEELSDLTKKEIRLKNEELVEKKKKLVELKKELKENQIARRKEKTLQKATVEQKEKHLQNIKDERKIDNEINKKEENLDIEREFVKDKALSDLKKEHAQRRDLIKKERFNQLENVRITSAQKKFYQDIVKKQETREREEEELAKIKKESMIGKGTLGLMGTFFGGKISGFFKDLVPGFGMVGDLVSFIKQSRKEQSDIAKEQLSRLEESKKEEVITEEKKENIIPTGDGGEIVTSNIIEELIEVNRQGFESIKNTLIRLDRGEDIEEEMERRDAERRRKKGVKEEIIVEEKEEKKAFFGKFNLKEILKKIAPFLLGLSATVLPVIAKVLIGIPMSILSAIQGLLANALLMGLPIILGAIMSALSGAAVLGLIGAGIKKLLPEKIEKAIDEKLGALKSKIGGLATKVIGKERVEAVGEKIGIVKEKGSELISKVKEKLPGKQEGGFIGKGGIEKFIGGEKGVEFLLDNQATNMFFRAVSRLEKLEGKAPTDKKQLNIFKQMLDKFNNLINLMMLNNKINTEIATKSFGNNINVIARGNEESRQEVGQVRFAYPSSRTVR